jgi:hypothetical protein
MQFVSTLYVYMQALPAWILHSQFLPILIFCQDLPASLQQAGNACSITANGIPVPHSQHEIRFFSPLPSFPMALTIPTVTQNSPQWRPNPVTIISPPYLQRSVGISPPFRGLTVHFLTAALSDGTDNSNRN